MILTLFGICTLSLLISRALANFPILVILLNIEQICHALCTVCTIIALRKHLNWVTVAILLANCIPSIGQLHFMENRLCHRITICLFFIAIIYTAGYLFYAFVIKKRRMEVVNLWLMNGILPMLFVGWNYFMTSIEQLNLIHTEKVAFWSTIGWIALGISVLTLILAIIFIKDRQNKKEYLGKLCAVFFLTLGIFFVIPALSTEYINYAFDTTPGEQTVCVVADKHTHHSGRSGTIYCLLLSANGEQIEFTTHKAIYSQYEIGDIFYLHAHQGAFDMSYYEYRWEELFQYPQDHP